MSRIVPKRRNVSKNVFYTDVGFIQWECFGYYTFLGCIAIFMFVFDRNWGETWSAK